MNFLDDLFDRWELTYPENVRAGFHRDGIIDEALFAEQAERVLFVLLEPNSRDGAYDRYYGEDLREVFKIPMSKEVNRNLGLWARYLLDGVARYERLRPEEARGQILRVALMNLKKIAGSGTADYVAVSQYAWQDREFLREQVRLIRPTVIVTCGSQANRVFAEVVENDLQASRPDDKAWLWNNARVVPANHPSLRPVHAADAFARLVERYSGGAAAGSSTSVPSPNAHVGPPTAGTVRESEPSPPPSIAETRHDESPSAAGGRGGWILRPYPHHNYRMNEFLQGRFIAIGWPGVGDLGGFDRERLRGHLKSAYPGRSSREYGDWVGTILRFRDAVKDGDLVVVAPSLAHSNAVAIAEVLGPYRYVPDLDGERQGHPHTRPVRWIVTALSRHELPGPVLSSLTQGTLHRTDGVALARFCRVNGWLHD